MGFLQQDMDFLRIGRQTPRGAGRDSRGRTTGGTRTPCGGRAAMEPRMARGTSNSSRGGAAPGAAKGIPTVDGISHSIQRNESFPVPKHITHNAHWSILPRIFAYTACAACRGSPTASRGITPCDITGVGCRERQIEGHSYRWWETGNPAPGAWEPVRAQSMLRTSHVLSKIRPNLVTFIPSPKHAGAASMTQTPSRAGANTLGSRQGDIFAVPRSIKLGLGSHRLIALQQRLDWHDALERMSPGVGPATTEAPPPAGMGARKRTPPSTGLPP
jgi:hypothetical protein